HPKERCLAGAVRADEADLLAGIELERGIDEEDLLAVLLADAGEGDHASLQDYDAATGLSRAPYTRRVTRTQEDPPSAAGLMNGLPPQAAADVLAASAVRNVDTQQVLFRQDDPAEALYLVESGRLKLAQLTPSGQTVTVRMVATGELCAAIA